MKKIISFTTILHKKRKDLGLSLMEYCIADTIHNLSNNPKSPVQGWCYASKDTLGEMLDTTRQTIFTCVKKLTEKGLIEKNNETKYLRTTEKWFNSIITEGENEEEIKEEPKEEIKKVEVLKYTKEDLDQTELLFNLMKRNTPELKEKSQSIKLKSYEEMNKLHRIDGWSYKQIEFIIRFSQSDNFWKTNILSVQKLRKQFETLIVKVKGLKNKEERQIMYAREDGTAFRKDFGKWVPVDNPKNIVDFDYYKSVAEDNLMTKKEYEQKFLSQVAQCGR